MSVATSADIPVVSLCWWERRQFEYECGADTSICLLSVGSSTMSQDRALFVQLDCEEGIMNPFHFSLRLHHWVMQNDWTGSSWLSQLSAPQKWLVDNSPHLGMNNPHESCRDDTLLKRFGWLLRRHLLRLAEGSLRQEVGYSSTGVFMHPIDREGSVSLLFMRSSRGHSSIRAYELRLIWPWAVSWRLVRSGVRTVYLQLTWSGIPTFLSTSNSPKRDTWMFLWILEWIHLIIQNLWMYNQIYSDFSLQGAMM